MENLKKTAEKNIMIFGSPGLVHSFVQLGLIDEVVININPIILGDGIPMFKDIRTRTNLHPVTVNPFASGVVGFYYKRSPQ